MEALIWTTVGFIIVILDLLVIPGGIFVVIGSGVILYSVYLNYLANGPLVAIIHLAVCLAILPKMVIFSFKRVALKSEMSKEDGYVGVEDRSHLVGLEGVARSTLRPGGTAMVMVDGEETYIDCIAEGGMIDQGEPIVVVEDRGASLVVRRAKPKSES